MQNEKQSLGAILDVLSRRLFVARCLHILVTYERSCCQNCQNGIFASNYLLQHCLQNCCGKNQDHHPNFLLDYLRSPEYGNLDSSVKYYCLYNECKLSVIYYCLFQLFIYCVDTCCYMYMYLHENCSRQLLWSQ